MKRTAKKFLSLLLVLTMTIGIAPLSGFVGLELPQWLNFKNIFNIEAEAEETNEFFTYTIENNEVTINKYRGGKIENVIIPSCIEGYPVTVIGAQAFYKNPNEVDSLPAVPVDPPEGESEYKGIVSVEIPDSVRVIESDAFGNCRTLETVIIGDGVEIIGESAFADCSSLETVIIGNGVKNICERAFEECFSLESIVIPDSVEIIGDRAFSECWNLKTITLGKNIKNVGYGVFNTSRIAELIRLTDIYYTGDIESWCNIENVMGLSYAMEYAENFYVDNTLLTEVVIPETVTEIKDHTFSDIDCIQSVYIPSSVTSIGKSAFSDCSNLETVKFEDGAKTIGGYAFYDCQKLTSVTLPESVTTIGESAFSKCASLEEIIIPDGVTVISLHMFEDCMSLSKVNLGNKTETICSYAFSECENLKSIVLPDSLKIIEGAAFDGCTGLESIDIPDKVTFIDDAAFHMCTGLKFITVGKSVETLGSYNLAFALCIALESITVDPENQYYCSDEYGVLYNKDMTALIQYPVGNTRKEFAIPEGVLSKNIYSFVCCENLESLLIPESFEMIESGAFGLCTNLKSVTIGSGVETIDVDAFTECINLTDVYYIGTEEEWNEIVIYEDGNEYLLNATIHFNSCKHTYNDIVIPSTCKVAGMQYKICVVCGDATEATILPLAEHTWSEWNIIREATTQSEGLKERECSVCGVKQEAVIPKTKEIIDDESGIVIEFGDEYDSDIELKVEKTFDGDSYQLIDLSYGSNQSVIFDISTVKDGEKVQPDGKVKVKIPLPEGFGTKNIFVCYVDSANGKVTNIPAKVVNGYVEFVAEHFSYYAVVEKLAKVNSVSIDDIAMNYKTTATIVPIINADEGLGYTVSYSSSDESVATVDKDGNVTSVGTGEAEITITITDENGKVTEDTCNVTVSYAWWQWIIIIILFGWIWY